MSECAWAFWEGAASDHVVVKIHCLVSRGGDRAVHRIEYGHWYA